MLAGSIHLPTWGPAVIDFNAAHDPLFEIFRSRRDEESLRAIMLEHAPAVRAVARRVVGRHDLAEDAVQEAFVRLSRDPEAVQGAIGPWLRTVAFNAAIDLLRQDASQRRCDRAFTAEAMRAADNGTLDAEVKRLIGDCIARLAEKHRAVIARRFFLGMDLQAIADEIGVSASAVHKRLRAALQALRWEILHAGLMDSLQAFTGGHDGDRRHGAMLMPDPASLSLTALLCLPRLISLAMDGGVRAGLAAAAWTELGSSPSGRDHAQAGSLTA